MCGDASPFASLSVSAEGAHAVLAPRVAVARCAGHFPDDPLLPGSTLTGLAVTVAEAWRANRQSTGGTPKPPPSPDRSRTRVARAAFSAPTRPDAHIEIVAAAAVARRSTPALDVDAQVLADGHLTARVHLVIEPVTTPSPDASEAPWPATPPAGATAAGWPPPSALLRHRPPLLLVERIVQHVPAALTCEGPRQPWTWPLLLEGCAQTAGLLTGLDDAGTPRTAVIAEYRDVVVPGPAEQVRCESAPRFSAVLERRVMGCWRYRCVAIDREGTRLLAARVTVAPA